MHKIANTPVSLLPFQFARFSDNEYLLVNECGDFLFLSEVEFKGLIKETPELEEKTLNALKSHHIVCTQHLAENIAMIATKYRSRKRFLSDFTSLHMMVLTLRCTNNCSYCQVSAEGEDAHSFDMTPETARRIVDIIFQSPSGSIKIEFQGGEPTLNWGALTETVKYAKKKAKKERRSVEFVVCTNLVKVTDDQLRFYKENQIHISTSLDGPENIHDRHRVLKNNKGTYKAFIANLQKTRANLGEDAVAALMTTTKQNIGHLIPVIDEYIENGFKGIFLRSLNPYGFANEKIQDLGYSPEEFVIRYNEALDYIIEYNIKTGELFIEYFAALLLSRILTPFSTGFVDLQSPSGAGISGAIYDHNGNVFPADEARMLSRMGDDRFLMGNVMHHSYVEIFCGSTVKEITRHSCVEVMPYCATCVYQAYCGSDPIRNYLATGDIMGRRPDRGFCAKNLLIFKSLFNRIKENDPKVMDVFWSWISIRSVSEIRMKMHQ